MSNLAVVVLKVAEISRVLRPGGMFIATTYILDGPFAFVPFLREGTKVYHLNSEPALFGILLIVPHGLELIL